MTLLAASTPPITKDFYEKLIRSFPLVRPEPNVTTMDEVMCGAGEQRVIDWIRAHGHTESIVTNADVSRTVNVRAR